jgi:hypothetical protein
MKPSSPTSAARVGAYLHCFRTRPDSIEPRLQRDRHLAIVRSLWRPAVRALAKTETPTLLLLADSGDANRTEASGAPDHPALAKAAKVQSVWFSPVTDLHLEFPERVADILDKAVRDGFFA